MTIRRHLMLTCLTFALLAPAAAHADLADGAASAAAEMPAHAPTAGKMLNKISPAAGESGAAAQNFVDQLGRNALGVISNSSLSQDQRKDTLRGMLVRNFDLAAVGRFVLGQYWRQATPAQQQEYQTLYQNMIVNVYNARFSSYAGQQLKVTGNRVDESGDVVVSSIVTGGSNADINVDWRARNKGGAYRIVDVMVEGISMAVTQRNDFAGVISKGGGNVDALLTYLRQGGTSDVKR